MKKYDEIKVTIYRLTFAKLFYRMNPSNIGRHTMNSLFIMKEKTEKRIRRERKNKGLEPYVEGTWESLVKRILYYCRLRKMNVNTLALKAGMTPSTLKSILYGKSKNPGVATIRHICDGLNISLDEFFRSKLFREW